MFNNTDMGLEDYLRNQVPGYQGGARAVGSAYINPNDKEYASKINAQLARRDWEDYRKRFMPIHGQFKDLVMGDQLVNEQLARVPGNVQNAFATSKQNADMRMQRMGLAEADTGRSDLAMATATAGAENNVRQHSKERAMAAIAGAPMPTVQGG